MTHIQCICMPCLLHRYFHIFFRLSLSLSISCSLPIRSLHEHFLCCSFMCFLFHTVFQILCACKCDSVHVDIRTYTFDFRPKQKKRNFKNAPVHCWYGDQCWTDFIFTHVFLAYTLIGMRTCTVRLRTHFHTHANTLIRWGPSYRIIQICVKDEGKRRNDRKKARIILDGDWKNAHTHEKLHNCSEDLHSADTALQKENEEELTFCDVKIQWVEFHRR